MTGIGHGRGRLTTPAVALAAAVLLGGCVPAAATSEGKAIGDLYRVFLVIGGAIGALVCGLATFAVLRYRRARDDQKLPPQVHGNTRLEVLWTAVPLITVLGLFAGTLLVLGRTEARAAQPAAEIRVVAHRWGWAFSYPAEGFEVSGIGPPGPEVVVPVGQPIHVTLTADDVNHAFFVPRFLFKRDAIPGRENTFDITVDEPGTYGGQCAEFCGIGHSAMPFRIRAVPTEEYAAWLRQQHRASPIPASPPPTASGAG